jgi:uncharacterized cupin superfamily protein
MTDHAAKLHAIAATGEETAEPIAPDRLIEGAPMTRTRIDYQQGEHVFVGEWASDIGAWRVAYDEWEYCTMLEGVCELTPDGGAPQRFAAGDSFVIEPGFAGIWRVLQPMRKTFVIRIG